MSEELINKVLTGVAKKMGGGAPAPSAVPALTPTAGVLPVVTELVGTSVLGDTIGTVIANVDLGPRTVMKLEKGSRSIEIPGTRTSAGPHIFATNEAVGATSSGILTIELPRDTKGGVDHGSLITFGAEDVFDVRRVVGVALGELDCTLDDVYGNDAGHLELQYIARVSYVLNKAFGTPIGKVFDITVGAPAGISVVLADTAVKAATVDVIGYANPIGRTNYSSEVIFFLDGDSGTVQQVIIAAREVGIPLLGTLGIKSESTTTPYI